MRLALCGLGSAAVRAHLPAIRALEARGAVEVVGVCDRSLDRRARGALMLGAPGFAEVHRMLHEVEPDLLIVATPPSGHVEAVRAGLNHGAHVVCEKPLGLRPKDVGELTRLQKRHSDLGLVTVHQYEYAPAWQPLARFLRSAIRHDEPWSACIEVERPGTDPLSAGGWRARPAVEGGILGDHAVHYLSMLWKLEPRLRLVRAERSGAGRDEHASVTLESASGRAEIRVSYAGSRRHNRIEVRRPVRDLTAVWDDDTLIWTRRGAATPARAVNSLSDRDHVNDLYRPFYADLVEGLGAEAWRRARWAESLGVARLLTTALGELVEEPRADRSYLTEDIRRIGRAIRHSLADRGINRGTEREVAIAQALSIDPHVPGQLETFLNHCIDAGMLTTAEATQIKLAPDEARSLALSLDGRATLTDEQADAWALQLGTG